MTLSACPSGRLSVFRSHSPTLNMGLSVARATSFATVCQEHKRRRPNKSKRLSLEFQTKVILLQFVFVWRLNISKPIYMGPSVGLQCQLTCFVSLFLSRLEVGRTRHFCCGYFVWNVSVVRQFPVDIWVFTIYFVVCRFL